MRTLPVRRRGYYYGWNIVAICVLAQLSVIGISINCFSLFLPLWSAEMSAPESTLLESITLLTLLGPFVSPVAGWASDRIPANLMMGVGLAVSAIAYAAVASIGSAMLLIVIYGVLLSPGMIFATAIPAQAVVSRWFGRRRGLAMGINAMGVVVAGVIFPPIVVYVLPTLGWRHLWLITAGLLALLVAPVALFGLYDRPADDDPLNDIGTAERESHGPALSYRAILGRPNFWILEVVYIAALSIYFVPTYIITPILLSRHFTMTMAGSIIATISFSAIVAMLSLGVLVDRIGNRIPLILVAFFACLGIALLAIANSTAMLFLAAVPLGFSNGIWTVLPSAIAAEFGVGSFGRCFGVISATTIIATLIAQLVQRIAEQSGSYTESLLGMAVFGVVGTLIAAMFRQPKPEPVAEVQLAE